MNFLNAISAFTRSALHWLWDTVCVTPYNEPNLNYDLHTLYEFISWRFPPNTLQREHYANIATGYLDYNNEMCYYESVKVWVYVCMVLIPSPTHISVRFYIRINLQFVLFSYRN